MFIYMRCDHAGCIAGDSGDLMKYRPRFIPMYGSGPQCQTALIAGHVRSSVYLWREKSIGMWRHVALAGIVILSGNRYRTDGSQLTQVEQPGGVEAAVEYHWKRAERGI